MNHKLSDSILQTLVYSDVFDCPLTLDDLHKYLYKYKISKNALSNHLNRLSFVRKIGKYYVLISREKIVSKQRLTVKESRIKMQKAKRIIRLIQLIPTIQLLGISGSVAVKNADKHADTDLFIITAKNTLWLTRFMVTVILLVVGKKRMPGMQLAPDTICTNMWMSDATLALPSKSLFHAREIVQLQVLINRNDSMQKFISANSWVLNYFPNFIPYSKSRLSLGFGHSVGSYIDQLLYRFQKLYMKKRISSEKISRNYAAFHPKDVAPIVQEIYAQRLNEYRKLYGCSLNQNRRDRPKNLYQVNTHITPGS